MNLIIPSRHKPTNDSFPTAPRKVRQWLAELYPVTSANSTRVLLRGLKHCNRLENTPKHRLEILDQFRPVVEELIHNAVSQYVGHNLPLSNREQNSFSLVITLLQELAFGYKIIVADSETATNAPAGKVRNPALYYAMEAVHELALRHLQVYQDIPAEVWQDCNALYAIAERLGVSRRDIAADLRLPDHVSSIEQWFIATHLLKLSDAHSLRRGQIFLLKDFIARHIEQTYLFDPANEPSDGKLLKAVDISGKAACDQLRFMDTANRQSLRAINLDHFVTTLEAEISNSPGSVSALYEADVLTSESLKRLHKSLQPNHRRASARAFYHQKTDVLHGLKEIYASFRYADVPVSPASAPAEELKLSVEGGLPSKQNRNGDFITHPARDNRSNADPWSGNKTTLADADDFSAALAASSVPAQRGEWLMMNQSEGGVALQWAGIGSPHVSVGELMAVLVRQPGKNEKQWMMGTITWLRVSAEQTMQCGLTHLATHARPVLVERTKGSHNSITTQTEALLARPVAEPDECCLILPAYMFHNGELVHIRGEQEVEHYRLTDKLESTGSFALFAAQLTGTSKTKAALSKDALADFGLDQS
ncbi:hypothetical protein Q4485_01055 [Granulosicoccaceae sp. 1_MG-2023]|nr:hypothetical protein [Granulosicoccaceae sp. 1_MG-2023]